MPYRENSEREPIDITPLPITTRALGVIRRTLTSTAFLWLALSIPVILALSYVDGAAAKFVVMRVTLAVAVIPLCLLIGRAIKAMA